MLVIASLMIIEREMWRVLDGEVKFHRESVRESFIVPGWVLNEIPALSNVDSSNNYYSGMISI